MDEFDSFVRARTPALLRSAYLLTGDQHLAEDLVQSALARTHRAWRRLQAVENAEAYTRRTMYHLQVSWWRRGKVAETLTGDLPEPRGRNAGPDHATQTAIRITLRNALRKLSNRQRAVLVLRFFEDRTEAEAAELLGVTVGTVKSQTAKALARMRVVAPELADLADDVRPVDLHGRALATSRKIGQQRAATAAAVVIAAVAGLTVALTWGGDRAPVVPVDTPTPTTGAPSRTPTAPATPSATATPASAPLTDDEVRGATIAIPDWNTDVCPAGTFAFERGSSGRFFMTEVVLADVDADGDRDAVVLITCSPDEVNANQVLALHRAPHGRVATLGQVAIDRPERGGGRLGDIEVAAGGAVRVRWLDTQPGAGQAAAQWRVYGWSGDRFRQTSGPTAFPPITIDLGLEVKTATVELRRDPSDAWAGDLVVTVTNAGDKAIETPTIRLTLPVPASVQSMTGAATKYAAEVDAGPPRILLATLKPLAPGKAVTVTMRLVYPGDAPPGGGTVAAEAIDDSIPGNDTAPFEVDPVE